MVGINGWLCFFIYHVTSFSQSQFVILRWVISLSLCFICFLHFLLLTIFFYIFLLIFLFLFSLNSKHFHKWDCGLWLLRWLIFVNRLLACYTYQQCTHVLKISPSQFFEWKKRERDEEKIVCVVVCVCVFVCEREREREEGVEKGGVIEWYNQIIFAAQILPEWHHFLL